MYEEISKKKLAAAIYYDEQPWEDSEVAALFKQHPQKITKYEFKVGVVLKV